MFRYIRLIFQKFSYILTFSKVRSQYWHLNVCLNIQYVGSFILRDLNACRSYPIQVTAETVQNCLTVRLAIVCVAVRDVDLKYTCVSLPTAGLHIVDPSDSQASFLNCHLHSLGTRWG